MNRCLGKLAPKHDLRTLRLARYLSPQLPPPPATCDWTVKCNRPFGMMLNDKIGCCTMATIGHLEQVLTANSNIMQTMPDDAILKAYSAVSGYDPQTGANDNGCNVLDVLKYWQKTGVGGYKVEAYAGVTPQSQREVMDTIYLFGGIYLGVALPLAWQDSKEWDYPIKIKAWQRHLYQPGSWGGHAIIGVAYDSHGVTVISWGEKILCTWAAFNKYMEEAYACLDVESWTSGKKQAPNGIDVVALNNDIKLLHQVA